MAPVKELLEGEGFNYRGYVDIFDAGPTLEARTDTLHTLTNSQRCQLKIVDTVAREKTILMLVSNLKTEDFRCTLMHINPERPEISQETAAALHIGAEDQVRLVKL